MNCAVCVGMIYAAILKESVVFVYYHSMIDGFLSARRHNQLSYYGWEFDNLWATAITGRHFSQLPEPLGHQWPQRNRGEMRPAAGGVTVRPSLLHGHTAARLPWLTCSPSLPLPGSKNTPLAQFHQVLLSPSPLPSAKRPIPTWCKAQSSKGCSTTVF